MAADEENVAAKKSSENGGPHAQLVRLQNLKLQQATEAPPPPLSTLSRRNYGTLAGNGDESYAKNSSAQGHAVQAVLPLLNEALDRLALPVNEGRGFLAIADLGCASGPNSLKNVDAIVTRLKARYAARGMSMPSLQVFFQDLPSNDFNNLFRLVSEENGFSDQHRASKDMNSISKPKYFVAGVPGTFYGRLFPDSSVHIIFSSYSLHWLSRVPDSISDKRSPAFNKGRSWVHGATPEVTAAYKERAEIDLRKFLNARAAEIVPGGVLFLLFVGRRNPDPAKHVGDEEGLPAIFWTLVDTVFDQMALEGFISEELKDSFNCATYLRSLEEVRDVVEKCSSDWRVMKLEAHPFFHFAEYFARHNTRPGESPHSFARRILLMYKVTQAPQIKAHVGPELSKVFWEKYEAIFFNRRGIVEDFYSRIKHPGNPATQILVSLIHK